MMRADCMLKEKEMKERGDSQVLRICVDAATGEYDEYKK